jgi:sucrose phosphorylase
MKTNSIQLITYADRMGTPSLKELRELMQTELEGLFGGLHLLPFFDPIDGEDAGFDPIDHTRVDPRLGDWEDIRLLGQDLVLMGDVIVNHMSAQSLQFKDYLERGEASEFSTLFLTFDKVFPTGAAGEDLLRIYRPRPGFPFTKFRLKDGEQRLIWTTFTSNQVDIDVNSRAGNLYLETILDTYEKAGIRMIRLDAAGYAIKKQGTSCFMIDETFEFIADFEEKAGKRGMEVLVEIHSHYQTQIEIASRVGYVYDFALPVLVLDCLYNRNASNLKKWIGIRPTNTVTVLDTHDGIGIVDVASEGEKPGLIPDQVLDGIVETMHSRNEGRSLKATGSAASNLDLYQVNCTYFEALGKNEKEYLIARAIQFFLPGIPQLYYVGLFGDENDMELLARTGVGRDINRHYYTRDEIRNKLKTPLVRNLSRLMRFRNSHPSFEGEFQLLDTEDFRIALRWDRDQDWSILNIDLTDMHAEMTYSDGKGSASADIF